MSTAGITELSKDMGSMHHSKSSGSKDRIRKLWDEFLEILNAEWFDHFGHIVHYCKDYSCCSGYDPVVCQNKIISIFVRCILRSKPQIPASIKWTKLGASLDFAMGFFLPHNMGAHIFTVAFDKLTTTVEKKAHLV